MKLNIELVVTPATVTDTLPDVAFGGTSAVIWLDKLSITSANTPFILTMLLVLVLLKPDPVIVRGVPTAPACGVNELTSNGNFKNSRLVEKVVASRVTEIGPVVASAGTSTDKLIDELLIMGAITPLNLTI